LSTDTSGGGERVSTQPISDDPPVAEHEFLDGAAELGTDDDLVRKLSLAWKLEKKPRTAALYAEAVAALVAVRAAAKGFIDAHEMQRGWKDDYEWPADEFAALKAAVSSPGEGT
jgi:hypothetical protein